MTEFCAEDFKRINMNEERRKALRTQGRYSEERAISGPKEKEKRYVSKSTSKEKHKTEVCGPIAKEFGSKQHFISITSRPEHKSPVQYQEQSGYNFPELEPKRKPEEIKTSGLHILSKTSSGESRLIYEPDFIPKEQADELFVIIRDNTGWNDKNIIIRGQEYPQPRLVAWYGPYPYSYSGVILESAQMPDVILGLKEKAEQYLRERDVKVELNSVLLNFYRNGKDSVAWHSDDELSLGVHPTIVSISLGAVRKFEIRPKQNVNEHMDAEKNYYLNLKHGSLLIMDGCMQKDWEHRVPKEFHDKPARLNLTFRTVFPLENLPQQIPIKRHSKETSKFHHEEHSNKNVFDRRNITMPLGDFIQPPKNTSQNVCHSSPSNLNNLSRNKDSMYGKKCVPSSKSDDQSYRRTVYDRRSRVSPAASEDSRLNLKFNSKDDSSILNDTPASINKLQESINDLNTNLTISSNEHDSQRESNEEKPKKCTLNVHAPNFYPTTFTPLSSKYLGKDLLSLIDCYNTELEEKDLKDFSVALKSEVLKFITTFSYRNDISELQFLCDITDGDQSPKNLKLICGRMCERAKLFSSHADSSRLQTPFGECSYEYPAGHEYRQV